MTSRIRQLISEYGGLSVDAAALGDGDDLYRAGLTSFASVQLMLALEDTFDIEFPDAMLNRATFSSLGAIEAAVAKLAEPAHA